ncbi:MAG: phosphoribosylamine--glycine ligase [Candidatus Levybacteria bacterium]|nr:phosphoribosylamine--glycine ligase [Candidatus Levybacteria bacterium]
MSEQEPPSLSHIGDRRVRIIGSGFREHALFLMTSQSPQIRYIDIAPGNGGTYGFNVNIAATDIEAQAKDAKARGIDTVIVGPEEPLALGIRDRMNTLGIDVFGPTAAQARIESGKWFAIQLMQAAGIPYPETRAFYDESTARRYIKNRFADIVIKENGLRGGKGVHVPDSQEGAYKALEVAFKKGLGKEPVLVQQRITDAIEASFMVLVDGEHVIPLPSAQDYKRIGDGDRGPNTGGVGGFSPTPTITPKLSKRIMQEIMFPMVQELRNRGMQYKGVLYAGLMIDKNGNPIVIEFNCRAGDPEFPIVSVNMQEEIDFLNVVDAVRNGTLTPSHMRFLEGSVSLGIVASSEGYPDTPKTGREIRGLGQVLNEHSFLFHSGTRYTANRFETSGGRVALGVGRGITFREARGRAENVINQVVFDGKQQRGDIGNSVIDLG